jgi:hypothetical protein
MRDVLTVPVFAAQPTPFRVGKFAHPKISLSVLACVPALLYED